MLLFPNAKINLGLNILRKRSDGYHELETIFYPIPLEDGLEFVPNDKGVLQFSCSGFALDVDPENNIVAKAYRLLAKDYPLPGLDIHLHKSIPFGAGLGGGSSDAAFMLKGLNDWFDLGLTPDQLRAYASQLGADCSFFVDNLPSFASGIGEVLQPIDLSLKGYFIVLVKPPYGVGTKEAYSQIVPKLPEIPIRRVIQMPIGEWQNRMVNDFEKSVFNQFPAIETIKTKMINHGAIYASMSGSGASVFGLFKHLPDLKASDFDPDYFFWSAELL